MQIAYGSQAENSLGSTPQMATTLLPAEPPPPPQQVPVIRPGITLKVKYLSASAPMTRKSSKRTRRTPMRWNWAHVPLPSA